MIDEKVKEVVAQALGLDQAKITLDSSMLNVEGWDSLAHFKIIAELEKSFLITFREEEILRLNNVEQIITILQSKQIVLKKETPEEKLQEILQKNLNIDTKDLKAGLNSDLLTSNDSFAGMMLFSDLEKAFNVRFTTQEVMQLRTYGQIKEALKKHGALGENT